MNQASAAQPNASMNVLSETGCPSCIIGRIRSSSRQVDLRKPQAARKAKHAGGREKQPGGRPVQCSRGNKQDRAKAHDP